MSVTEAVEVEPARWPTGALADALMDRARAMASAECAWLGLLAEFDRREGWRADGQLSGVAWLGWRCGMARRTAREKLRVAHELERRPAVRDAFATGELSWCQVRAITRIEGADAETDERLMEPARLYSVANLEGLVRHWQLIADQERGAEDYLARYDQRQLRASRTFRRLQL